MSDITLKPCPFCAGPAKMTATYNRRTGGFIVLVKCTICGSQSRAFFADINPELESWNTTEAQDAAAVWNMRNYKK